MSMMYAHDDTRNIYALLLNMRHLKNEVYKCKSDMQLSPVYKLD
jgi:hypothetical protein